MRGGVRGSENVYAKYCMYIGCYWMYVYETIAVEFEGGCRCLCGTRGLRCILCIIYTSIVGWAWMWGVLCIIYTSIVHYVYIEVS